MLTMLAGCPSGVACGCPKTRHGTSAKRVPREPPNEVARGPVEKRGSNDCRSRLLQATPRLSRTHRTHALGDRALPDLMAAASAADPSIPCREFAKERHQRRMAFWWGLRLSLEAKTAISTTNEIETVLQTRQILLNFSLSPTAI